MIKSGPWKASGDDDWNHINSVDINGSIIIMLIEKRWWANYCFCYPITWSRFSSRQAAEADKGKPQHHRADETIIELHFVRLWIAGNNLETAIENSFLVGWIMKTTQKVGNRRHETTRGPGLDSFCCFSSRIPVVSERAAHNERQKRTHRSIPMKMRARHVAPAGQESD